MGGPLLLSVTPSKNVSIQFSESCIISGVKVPWPSSFTSSSKRYRRLNTDTIVTDVVLHLVSYDCVCCQLRLCQYVYQERQWITVSRVWIPDRSIPCPWSNQCNDLMLKCLLRKGFSKKQKETKKIQVEEGFHNEWQGWVKKKSELIRQTLSD